MDWRELNMAISKAMQNYCGGVKCDALLHEGLDLLESFETEIVPQISCKNPHELMRAHEVFDILTVSKLILHACLSRKTSSEPLFFKRTDSTETDPERDRRFITVRQENGEVIYGSHPLYYFGDLETEYEKRNGDYIRTEQKSTSVRWISSSPRPKKASTPSCSTPASATTAAHASWRARTTVPSASSTPS